MSDNNRINFFSMLTKYAFSGKNLNEAEKKEAKEYNIKLIIITGPFFHLFALFFHAARHIGLSVKKITTIQERSKQDTIEKTSSVYSATTSTRNSFDDSYGKLLSIKRTNSPGEEKSFNFIEKILGKNADSKSETPEDKRTLLNFNFSFDNHQDAMSAAENLLKEYSLKNQDQEPEIHCMVNRRSLTVTLPKDSQLFRQKPRFRKSQGILIYFFEGWSKYVQNLLPYGVHV